MAEGTVKAAPYKADKVSTESTVPPRPSAIQRRPQPNVQ